MKTYLGIFVRPHRTDRKLDERTSVAVLQLGMDKEWWAVSMECYCYLRNIQDLLSDGKTPCERRFGIPFKGAIIPFSSMVEYHPNSAKDLSRLHTANIGAAIRQIPNSTNIFDVGK